MKMITKSAMVAGVGMLAVTTMLAKGHGGGQPVHTEHFTASVVFTNTGAGASNEAATAKLSSSINNNSDKESISLSAKGLTPSAPYSLFATSFGSNQDVVDFNADKKGNAKLALKNTGTSKKPATLPFGLEAFNITELDIVNDSDTNNPVTELTADTTSPKTFTFSDKEAQTGTNGETGTLSISAGSKGRSATNGVNATLSLTASGLNTNTDFLLALNGSTSGTGTNDTFTSDSHGNLKISNVPITSNVLDLTEVDLLDTSAGNAAVLTFPLP